MKACSMCAVVRSLTSVIDTAAETTDTTVETTAVVAAEMITEKAAEKTSEKTTEEAAEKTAKSMMMLKIESKLMILKTEMIDVDDIFDFENSFLRHVKLTL